MALGFGGLDDVQRLSPGAEAYVRKVIGCAQKHLGRVLGFWLLDPSVPHVIRIHVVSEGDSPNYYWLRREAINETRKGKESFWGIYAGDPRDPKQKWGTWVARFTFNETQSRCVED